MQNRVVCFSYTSQGGTGKLLKVDSSCYIISELLPFSQRKQQGSRGHRAVWRGMASIYAKTALYYYFCFFLRACSCLSRLFSLPSVAVVVKYLHYYTTVNVMPPMIYIRALVPYCVLHYVRLNVCCLVSKYGNAVFISPCFVCAFGGVEGTPGG